jgi:hypothetical protein
MNKKGPVLQPVFLFICVRFLLAGQQFLWSFLVIFTGNLKTVILTITHV